MITQRRYLIQHPAFISLFVFNLLMTTYFLFIDEGNYSFVEFQHFYTWVYLLVVAALFTVLSGITYLIFDRMTNLEMIIKIILAGSLTLPGLFLLILMLSSIIRLFT